MTTRLRFPAPPVHDVAVIIVSTNQAHWLRRCLTTLHERMGEVSHDVVVVDNGGEDEAGELLGREFPTVRLLRCENRGFAHANNAARATCDARAILLLNPDTELLEGTVADALALLDRADVGIVGVRQVGADGS